MMFLLFQTKDPSSAIEKVDFFGNPDHVRLTLNKWVENKTSNLIKDLLPKGSIDSMTVMAILNAVYFKGSWKEKFNQNYTRNETFFSAKGSSQVQMMYKGDTLVIGDISELGASYIDIPYDNDRFSMLAILPFESNPNIDRVVQELTPKHVQLMFNNEQLSKSVSLGFPRFEVLESCTLKRRIIESMLPMCVSNIFHKVFVKVDEEGTEAAAATGLGFRINGRDISFRSIVFNRPFAFILREKSTNAILFMGILERRGRQQYSFGLLHLFYVLFFTDFAQPLALEYSHKKGRCSPCFIIFTCFPSKKYGPAFVCMPNKLRNTASLIWFYGLFGNSFLDTIKKSFITTSVFEYVNCCKMPFCDLSSWPNPFILTILVFHSDFSNCSCITDGENCGYDDVTIDSVSDAIAQFTLKQYKEMVNDTMYDNILTSPYSIWSALAFTYLGARGESSADLGTLTWIIIHVYFQHVFQMNDSFVPFDEANFRFNPDGERIMLNTWVESKTHGLIKDLLPQGSVSSSTLLAIINAVYFKGHWLHPFEKDSTEEEFFYSEDQKSKVQMMHREGNMNFGNDYNLGASYVDLPYADDKYSLLAILPHENTSSIDKVFEKMTPSILRSIWNSTYSRSLQLSFPRFDMTESYNLKKVISKIGARNIFESINLSGAIDAPITVRISDVFHKVFLKVDEEGTEAAGGTGVAVNTAAIFGQPKLVFNRPFAFILREKSSNTILFMGIVRKLGDSC
ncbi:Serpin B9 [Nymphon striatum]|nr:Serpin B9 [Nymphon striatum]